MFRHSTHSISRLFIVPAIVLALALAGCGASANGHPKTGLSSSPTSTATTAATATPHQQPPAACTSNGGSPLTFQKIQVGRAGAYDNNTWEWLPDNLPLTPQSLSSVTPVALGTLGSAMTFGVDMNVPAAAQPGYVCGVTVRIVAFQPLSEPATNVYHKCVDQFYMDPGGFMPTSACPATGIPAGDGDLTFATSAVGTEATSSITYQPQPDPSGTPVPGAGLPAQIPQPAIGPGGACCAPNDMTVNVHVPQPGTYTFAFSLWQDSSGPSVTGPNVTAMFLFGQATREWGGQPCTQPAMQSQLPPATNPPTQIICPGSAPTVQ